MVDFLTVKMIETSGVFDKDAGDMLVSEKPAPSLAVLVAMGAAWVRKTDGSMVYPASLEVEDAEVAVVANASGNPRIDAVVLYVDLAEAPNTDATNIAILSVVQGAPSATPSAPSDAAIAAAIGAANPFIRLANVTVANGVSEILDADIEDTRENFVMASVFNQDFEMGDVKQTFKETLSGRWLKMDGKTIGGSGSTADYKGDQYKPLFDYIVDVLGYTPTAAWASNGKVVLPDAVDRVLMGAGSSYGLGTSGGSNTHTHTTGNHTLTEAEIPSHTHVQNAHNHSDNGHTHGVSDPTHSHTTPFSYGDQDGSGSNGALNGGATGTSAAYTGISIQTGYASIANATATNQNTGGGGAHNHGDTGSANHVPKYLAVNKFIKF